MYIIDHAAVEAYGLTYPRNSRSRAQLLWVECVQRWMSPRVLVREGGVAPEPGRPSRQ